MSARDQQKKCAEGFAAFIQRRRAEIGQSVAQREQHRNQMQAEYDRCRVERPCTCLGERDARNAAEHELEKEHKRLENLSVDNARARAIYMRDCKIAAGRQQASVVPQGVTQQRPGTPQRATNVRRTRMQPLTPKTRGRG